MSKELADLQDLKSVFISHCRNLGCDENYIKVCENKFGNIETALKRLEKLNKYYPKVIDDNTKLAVICAREQKALKTLKEIFNLRLYGKQGHFFICSGVNGETPISNEKAEILTEALL